MRSIRREWPLRLASVALAAALWFVIAGRQTAERGLSVPVELRNVPRDIELTEEAARTVEVRLRASPGLIDTLDPGKVLAIVDLSGADEGERIVQLTPERIQVPFGFRVVRITPSQLTLRLESTRHTTVPVEPRLVGQPASGYELAGVDVDPAEVHISGPRSSIGGAQSAFTEPVSIEGADTSVQRSVNVGLADPHLRLDSAGRVKVTVRLREIQATRVFEDLPVAVRGAGARVDPPRVSVVMSGPQIQVRSFDPKNLRLFVDVPADLSGPRKVKPGVELSGGAGLNVLEIRPADVTLRTLRRTPAR